MFNNVGFFIVLFLFHFSHICSQQSSDHFDVNAFNTDSIEYDLPKYNTKQWVVGDTITFTLPLNIKVTGTVKSVQLFDGLHYFIEGSVPNAGWFSASYFEDAMNANINYDGNKQLELRPSLINKSTDPTKKTYTMRYANINDEYVVKECDLDTAMMRIKAQKSLPSIQENKPNTIASNNISTKTIRLKATVNLRVLVLYTKQAVTAAGSESNLLSTIILAIGNYNLAMANSVVDVTVDYVAERMVEYDTYVEDASMSVMLSQMGSGTISTARRYIVGAHAVQLVTNNAQYCGLGSYSFSGQTNGLSVTNQGCIGGYASLAHEVGHNIGLHHDLSVYSSSGINHGSCWDVSSGTTSCRRSVMAYASCVTSTGRTNCARVMYWSSPTVADSGNVVGDSTNNNNAQQLRNNINTFITRYTMAPSLSPAGSTAVVYSPSITPTAKPIFAPTKLPTISPIPPTFTPTIKPTYQPSMPPTAVPTSTPSVTPTIKPTNVSSKVPTLSPSLNPIYNPSATPTCTPSSFPTRTPTVSPSQVPTLLPSYTPSSTPSALPTTLKPSSIPTTIKPTLQPSYAPSYKPTAQPSFSQQPIHYSHSPSTYPTLKPSPSPSYTPSVSPNSSHQPTFYPPFTPTSLPSSIPTIMPSIAPSTLPTVNAQPSISPTNVPSTFPNHNTTIIPTDSPTVTPSVSQQPVLPINIPTTQLPTVTPSFLPSFVPTVQPSNSQKPTFQPFYSKTPIYISTTPSAHPTIMPSPSPSHSPTFTPSSSKQPSYLASSTPTLLSTAVPSVKSSYYLSTVPFITPTYNPTAQPTANKPSTIPSNEPSIIPSIKPTTFKPAIIPSQSPSITPTATPSDSLIYMPSYEPSVEPTIIPSAVPSVSPTINSTTTTPPVAIVQNSKNMFSSFTPTMMYGVITVAASCFLLLCVMLMLRYRFKKGSGDGSSSKYYGDGAGKNSSSSARYNNNKRGSAKDISDIYSPRSSHGGEGLSSKFTQILTSASESIFISPRGSVAANINNTTKSAKHKSDERNKHLRRTFSKNTGLLISPNQKRRSRAFTNVTSGTESPERDNIRNSNAFSENDDDENMTSSDVSTSPVRKLGGSSAVPRLLSSNIEELNDDEYSVNDNDDDEELEQVDESSKFLPISSIPINTTHSRRHSLNNNTGGGYNSNNNNKNSPNISPRIKFTQENAKLTQNISSAFNRSNNGNY